MNVRLTRARAFELDPNKAYLIFLKKSVVKEGEAQQLLKQLTDLKVSNVVVAVMDKDAYKIVEMPVAAKQIAKKSAEQAKANKKKEGSKE